MKIRRYTCKDMQEAMLKVKTDLGSEAVIMTSRKIKPKGLRGLFSKPMVEVVAAIDDDDVRPLRKNPYRQKRQVFPYGSYGAYGSYAGMSARPPERPPEKPVEHIEYTGSIERAAQPVGQAVPLTNQTRIAEPVPEPAVFKASSQKLPGASNGQEKQKITELESKVKNMEGMLQQIYKTVQSGKEPGKPNSPAERPNPPAGQGPAAEPQESPEVKSLSRLRDVLYGHDIEPKLIKKILEKIEARGGDALKPEEVFRLAEKIITVLLGKPEPIVLDEGRKPHVAVFIGPTGVGKTTTLAKIAADFTLNKQKKVGLITADTYRIAAVEQLKTYAEILNLPVSVVYSPSEIRQAVDALSDNDLILIDTAGRSHKNREQFEELKTFVNVVNADGIYLVISCNTSRASMKEILEHYAFIKNFKLIFTKVDESAVRGLILNARYMTGKPLCYMTTGQSVPDDLEIADIGRLVTDILAEPDSNRT